MSTLFNVILLSSTKWQQTATTMGSSTLGHGGRGQLIPQPRPCPAKCNMKRSLTNSKHQHIGAKWSILWHSKYSKMRFRPGICPQLKRELMALARPPSQLRGHPSPYHPTRRIFQCHDTVGLIIWPVKTAINSQVIGCEDHPWNDL